MNSSEKLKTLLRLGTASSLMLAMGAIHAPQVIAQDADTDAEDEELEEVVVTGSRIRRTKIAASAPVDVIRAEAATLSGVVNVGALLQQSTVAAGNQQVTAATGTEFVQNGGIGAETISLRGLGANRTLVLVNGRRAGPAGVRGSVSSFDLNTFPLAAIDRVEVLKDGASSVYGSDAVAGVINIITKKGDGGVIDGFVSVPEKSGGEIYQISGSYGWAFDRGNFRITGDYYKQMELARGDRDYFQCGQPYIFDANTGDRADAIDPRTGDFACQDLLWGHIWLYDYAADPNFPTGGTTNLLQYDFTGDLARLGLPALPAGDLTVPDGWFPVNYDKFSSGFNDFDHPFQNEQSLIPSVERFTVMAEGEYEVTDNITLYGEALFNRRENYQNGYRQIWTYIYNGNAETGFGVADPVASSDWGGANWLSPTAASDHNDSKVTVDYLRFVGGARGDFGDTIPGWNWDISGQYSRSDGDYTDDQISNSAIRGTNWRTVESCAGDTGPACTIDWTDPEVMRGNVSQEFKDFYFTEETGNTKYIQASLEAVASGEVFELPAGMVAMAFGAHWRKDKIEDRPGLETCVRDSLEDNQCTGNNSWLSDSAGITFGDSRTLAVFGEADVPLLKDLPLIQALDLNASVRYTDTTGENILSREKPAYSGTTYKVGLSWEVNEDLRFRATIGTSFRSPALFELYVADQTSSIRQSNDPCFNWGAALDNGAISQTVANNCTAEGIPDDLIGFISATVLTGGGGSFLEPETSTSKTLGMVYTPEWSDMTLTVDLFDIQVRNEIRTIGAGNILRLCYNSDDFANEPFCDLITRSSGGQGQAVNELQEVRDGYVNIATQDNRGIDVRLTWDKDFDFGHLTFNTQHTITFQNSTEVFEGLVEDSLGEGGEPKYVGNASLNLVRDKWEFYWKATLIGSTDNTARAGGTQGTYFGTTVNRVYEIPLVQYHDASATYHVMEDLYITAGVSNVFNKKPPRVSTAVPSSSLQRTVGDSAFYTQYDWRARRFFMNIRKSF